MSEQLSIDKEQLVKVFSKSWEALQTHDPSDPHIIIAVSWMKFWYELFPEVLKPIIDKEE